MERFGVGALPSDHESITPSTPDSARLRTCSATRSITGTYGTALISHVSAACTFAAVLSPRPFAAVHSSRAASLGPGAESEYSLMADFTPPRLVGTPRSLIVLDEIGRGTSTFDGISIAWSVAEYLHENPKVKAKTLFATHYHELTDLAERFPGVKNWTVRVKQEGERIVFLRRVAPGVAEKSFGIHVAAMAGLPKAVVDRASQILKNLEANDLDVEAAKIVRRPRKKLSDLPGQMTLF